MAEIFRQKMPISHRAKQFAPFKSLKGFEEALKQKETEFLIKDEPTEEKTMYLNQQLNLIKKGKKITVTYFCNGEYITVCDILKDIDYVFKTIKINDILIPINDIWDLDIQ